MGPRVVRRLLRPTQNHEDDFGLWCPDKKLLVISFTAERELDSKVQLRPCKIICLPKNNNQSSDLLWRNRVTPFQ